MDRVVTPADPRPERETPTPLEARLDAEALDYLRKMTARAVDDARRLYPHDPGVMLPSDLAARVVAFIDYRAADALVALERERDELRAALKERMMAAGNGIIRCFACNRADYTASFRHAPECWVARALAGAAPPQEQTDG